MTPLKQEGRKSRDGTRRRSCCRYSDLTAADLRFRAIGQARLHDVPVLVVRTIAKTEESLTGLVDNVGSHLRLLCAMGPKEKATRAIVAVGVRHLEPLAGHLEVFPRSFLRPLPKASARAIRSDGILLGKSKLQA